MRWSPSSLPELSSRRKSLGYLSNLLSKAGVSKSMKIVHATPMGSPMEENAVKEFLKSKMNLQIATIDSDGDPVIQPVWYLYDQNADKIYINTSRESQKVKNIGRKDIVYFSVDEDASPYRCVKGKARASVSEDSNRNLSIVEKMVEKYLGDLDHPFSRQMLDQLKRGDSLVIELSPTYYSAWDFGQD